MVVYVEVVLLENLLIDGLILWLMIKSLKLKTNWWGIICASLVGSLFALFSVFINISGFLSVIIKLLVAVLMCVLVCFNFKKLFVKTLLFVLYTFMFGGALIAIFSFFGISTSQGVGISYNSEIPVGLILSCSVILFLTTFMLIKKFYKNKKMQSLYFDFYLTINRKKQKLKGFLDTGNTLVSSMGKPVVLVSQKWIKSFFDARELMLFYLQKYSNIGLKDLQKLSVQSLSGKQEIVIFDAECCEVNHKKVNICVGFCKDTFFKKDFDAILNSKMLEGCGV